MTPDELLMKEYDYWKDHKLEPWSEHHQTIDALKAGAEAIREVERLRGDLGKLNGVAKAYIYRRLAEEADNLRIELTEARATIEAQKQRIAELEAQLKEAKQHHCHCAEIAGDPL